MHGGKAAIHILLYWKTACLGKRIEIKLLPPSKPVSQCRPKVRLCFRWPLDRSPQSHEKSAVRGRPLTGFRGFRPLLELASVGLAAMTKLERSTRFGGEGCTA